MNEITKTENKLSLGKFYFDKTGLTVTGDPTFEEWQDCGGFLKQAEKSVQFWIGDWLNYGEKKYGETYTQAIDVTGQEYQTIANQKYVSSKIEISRRRENLSFSHHAEVASLPPEEQELWLDKAEHECLTRNELRNEIKASKYNPSPIPEDKYDVIYLDPPWQYSNSGISGAAENHYPTMNIEELASINIPSADNSTMFLWVTNPILFEAMPLIEKWGFEYKTNIVWIKDKAGQGFYVKGQHELLLVCIKGMHRPDESLYIRSVVESPREEHSKKPEIFYKIIEEMYPNSRYLEMFARNKRTGWESWGNEPEIN